MIGEEKQDQIIAYLLGATEPAEARELAAELQRDAELRQFADELQETMAGLAHAVARVHPPPQLRAAVLSSVSGEEAASPAPAPQRKVAKTARLPEWLPWAIAAGIIIAMGVQFVDRERYRTEAMRLRAEARSALQESAQLRSRNEALEAEAKMRAGQAAQLRQELETWKRRDALSEVRIATLSAQVAALSKAGAVIVWDAEQQRGIVKLSNVPRAEAGKDYQLWVIDPKYPKPVSAGVVAVGAGGGAYVSFSPTQPISRADKFAISIERTGGAPAPAGPIVLVGD